jgi:hypothetical protein
MSSTAAKTELAEVGSSVRVRRAVVASAGKNPGGVVNLDAEDFAQLEECMTNQQGPNEAMLQAAKFHKTWTSGR